MLPAGVTFPKFNVGEDPRLTFDTEVLTLLTGSRRANTTGHVIKALEGSLRMIHLKLKEKKIKADFQLTK